MLTFYKVHLVWISVVRLQVIRQCAVREIVLKYRSENIVLLRVSKMKSRWVISVDTLLSSLTPCSPRSSLVSDGKVNIHGGISLQTPYQCWVFLGEYHAHDIITVGWWWKRDSTECNLTGRSDWKFLSQQVMVGSHAPGLSRTSLVKDLSLP